MYGGLLSKGPADELNRAMTHEGKPPAGADVPRPDRPWFYGKLSDALSDLPHAMLNQKELASVDDVRKAMGEIRQQIKGLYLLKFAHKIGPHD